MNDKLIKIGDKTYKECSVIMLPTTDDKIETPLFKLSNGKVGYIPMSKDNEDSSLVYQNLYITSSGTIKGAGVPFIGLDDKLHISTNENIKLSYPKVVIASTDSSLSLPRPSDDFIKKFVESNGKIKNILVEYEEKCCGLLGECIEGSELKEVCEFCSKRHNYQLKVAPDNTISIIKKQDKVYSKEEVERLIIQAWINGETNKDAHYTVKENWIKNNLK